MSGVGWRGWLAYGDALGEGGWNQDPASVGAFRCEESSILGAVRSVVD